MKRYNIKVCGMTCAQNVMKVLDLDIEALGLISWINVEWTVMVRTAVVGQIITTIVSPAPPSMIPRLPST